MVQTPQNDNCLPEDYDWIVRNGMPEEVVIRDIYNRKMEAQQRAIEADEQASLVEADKESVLSLLWPEAFPKDKFDIGNKVLEYASFIGEGVILMQPQGLYLEKAFIKQHTRHSKNKKYLKLFIKSMLPVAKRVLESQAQPDAKRKPIVSEHADCAQQALASAESLLRFIATHKLSINMINALIDMRNLTLFAIKSEIYSEIDQGVIRRYGQKAAGAKPKSLPLIEKLIKILIADRQSKKRPSGAIDLWNYLNTCESGNAYEYYDHSFYVDGGYLFVEKDAEIIKKIKLSTFRSYYGNAKK
jgi:hypothetical protein